MRRTALKNQLLHYLATNPGWHKKVELYLVSENLGFSPESGARRLRELADEGKITAGYYAGKYAKKLTKYTADETPQTSTVQVVTLEDGTRVAKMI